MAPAAGKILAGAEPQSLGRLVDSWVRLSPPVFKKVGSRWEGEILAVDRFGNLITSFPNEEVRAAGRHAKLWFELKEGIPPIRGLAEMYSAVEIGRLLAIAGSTGTIELAARDENAAQKTGLKAGDSVTLTLKV